MAVILGNLALLLDVTSTRTVLPDRKIRPGILDTVLNLNLQPKREGQFQNASIATAKVFDSEGEGRSQRVVARGKSNSKMNGVDFDAGSSDEENGYDEGDEEGFDWEKEMRRRVKEIEERRELEKKAEELRSQMDDDDGEGDDREETEEEKRMRVRKELEKVNFF